MARTAISTPVVRSTTPTSRADLVRQTQSAGAQAASVLNKFPLQPGTLVKGVSFAPGAGVDVIHGLGRIPNGWIVTRFYNYVSGTGCLVEVAANPPTKQILHLAPQGTFTADIWIF